MGYFDKTWVSDRHVLDIVSRQNIDAQLSALDDEIKAVCMARGVPVAGIPTDADGHITSAMLKRYAGFWLYFTILHDYWGASGLDTGMTQDIYKAKLEYYETRMIQARNDLTADNITERVLDETSYVRQVPVY
jgi:hypothetical protein